MGGEGQGGDACGDRRIFMDTQSPQPLKPPSCHMHTRARHPAPPPLLLLLAHPPAHHRTRGGRHRGGGEGVVEGRRLLVLLLVMVRVGGGRLLLRGGGGGLRLHGAEEGLFCFLWVRVCCVWGGVEIIDGWLVMNTLVCIPKKIYTHI